MPRAIDQDGVGGRDAPRGAGHDCSAPQVTSFVDALTDLGPPLPYVVAALVSCGRRVAW